MSSAQSSNVSRAVVRAENVLSDFAENKETLVHHKQSFVLKLGANDYA